MDEDFAFHAAVAAAARNHFFTATLAMLDSHIRFGINLTRKLSLRQPIKRLLLVQEEHRQMAEAIARRDAAAAARDTDGGSRRQRLPGLGPARRNARLRRSAGQPAQLDA